MMPPHILIVDDEENLLVLLKRVLGKDGYRITCSESGAKALRLAEEYSFALAIVDVSIPDLNGIQLLEKLKEIDPEIPVIMITAYPSWEKEKAARERGCVEYLLKPLNMRRLKELVRNEIEKASEGTRR